MVKKVTSGVVDLPDFFSDLAVDLQVKYASDDKATNFMEFYEHEVDHEAWGIRLDRRQLLIIKVFYGLELDDEDISILEAWALPGINRTTYDLDLGPQLRQALVLEAGRRAGKTVLSSVIAAYEWYKLCMLDNPQKHYGMASSSRITIVCVASSSSQTERTIFGELTKFLNFIPKIKRYIDRGEIEIIKGEIRWSERLLHIYSGNSNSGSQVGGAIICLVLDEAARFDHDNALELWTNLGIGGMTFKHDAKRIAISSAWKEGDAIQKLWNACPGEQSIVGFRMRSWDLNPIHGARDNPIVSQMYALEPAKAALEFEGIRDSNISSFFNDGLVRQSFTCMSSLNATVQELSGDDLVRLSVLNVDEFYGRTILHLDSAVSGDNYALAFGHAEQIAGQTHVFVDGILVWEPKGKTNVSITNVQNCIYQIHARRPIALVTSDHYGAAVETLQRLKANGIKTETIYASNKEQYESYTVIKDLMTERRLHLPKNSLWTNLTKDELIYLQDLQTKVDHLPDKSKDVADCIASLCKSLAGTAQVHESRIITATNQKTLTYNDFTKQNNNILYGRGAWRALSAQD